MSPLRKLLLVGGLAASLITGCAGSEEPSRIYTPNIGVATYSDYGGSKQEDDYNIGSIDIKQQDPEIVLLPAENKLDKSYRHLNTGFNLVPPQIHLTNDYMGKDVNIEIRGQPQLERDLPIIDRCYARKGDEFVSYSALSVDPDCNYDYITMDSDERFVLVCKKDCPLPQDYLDRKFVAIGNTFDNLEAFLGVPTPSSIKPIEIHITTDDVCTSDRYVTSTFIEREGVWRGRICYPTYEKNEGDLSRLLLTVDNPDSMIGHEASHLILGKLYDMPYLWSEWQSRVAEAASKGEAEDMCDHFLDRRAFTTDNKVHGIAEWSYQIEYDLCQLGFNAEDSSRVLSRINEKRDQLGITELLPFNLAINEFDRYLTEKQETATSVIPILTEAGLEDTLIPFLDQAGVKDITVKSINYKFQDHTISANICNLGSLVTDDFNVDLRIGDQSQRLMQMGKRRPYDCYVTRPLDLESELGIPRGVIMDVDVQIIADVDNRVLELNEDNNTFEKEVRLGELPVPDLFVRSIYSSLFGVPVAERHHKAIYAEVCSDRDLSNTFMPFEYRFSVNGQVSKEGFYEPRGASCEELWIYYPEDTFGIDQGETPEITFEIDPNYLLNETRRDNNVLTVSYELPNRGER